MNTADCLRGKGYVKPAAGDVVDSAQPITISWEPSCFQNTSGLDIYLYAPQLSSAILPIHGWRNFPVGEGTQNVKLQPKWWITDPYKSSLVQLKLNIVPSGNEPWDTANPTGPAWSANYTSPGPGKNPPDDAIAKEGVAESVISVFYAGGGLTAGGKAAAVICPLVVVGVLLGLWIRKLHISRNNKLADWAEKMDQRMSRVSLDWMRGGDGSAGPIPGSRPASYMHRPSRDLNGTAAGLAGRGAGATANDYAQRGMSLDNVRDRRQSRISFAHETAGDRVSRISFGPNSSTDHGRGHKTSASLSRIGQSSLRHSFYDGNAPAVPKIDPTYRDSAYSDAYADGAMEDLDDLAMSPTQHNGPAPLSNHQLEQMRSSLDAQRVMAGAAHMDRNESTDASDRAFRDSVLKYPAVSMISSGDDAGAQGGDMFAAAAIDSADGYTHDHAGSANPTSPDEALKQYAALRAGAISPADPHAPSGNNVMRALYTPEAAGHAASQAASVLHAQKTLLSATMRPARRNTRRTLIKGTRTATEPQPIPLSFSHFAL